MSIIKLYLYVYNILNFFKIKPREKNLPDPLYMSDELFKININNL